MKGVFELSVATTLICTLSLVSCSDEELGVGLGSMYVPTDMYINNDMIYRYNGSSNKDEWVVEPSDDTCENFVYSLDGIDYYYDTIYCDDMFNKEYMVYTRIDGSDDYHGNSLSSYVYMSGIEFSEDDFDKLYFIKSKESNYVPNGTVIAVDGIVNNVLAYSDTYKSDNSDCMSNYEKVLFEDSDYEYRYSYNSCSSDETEHVLMHGLRWDDLYECFLPNYVGIDEYIDVYKDYLDSCDIDRLGITSSVPKA